VCPGKAGCQPIADWATCYLGLAPTHSFVGTDAWLASPTGRTAATFLAGLDAGFINATRAVEPAQPTFLFNTAAAGMTPLDPAKFGDHFGQRSLDAFEAIRTMSSPTARICTISAEEQVRLSRIAT
jgi:hypothetical protein